MASQLCVPLAMLYVFLCIHTHTNVQDKEVKSVQAVQSSALYLLFGQHSFAALVFSALSQKLCLGYRPVLAVYTCKR